MKREKYSFNRRVILAFLAVCIMLFISGARLLKVNLGGYSQAAAAQGQYSLTLFQSRGTVYDRNRLPLSNLPSGYVAAVTATPRSVTLLRSVLPSGDYSATIQRLRQGKPAILELDSRLSADGITVLERNDRYSGLSPHIVGYTDSDNHGVSGIEAAWDSLLYSEGSTNIIYSCDALGRVLSGIAPTVNEPETSADGVVLTIDSRIQQIVQEETAEMGCGAAVVLDVKSGEMLALHSFPAFDPNDPSAALNADDSPFLNRALTNYNAGSVFKTCVAAAALEDGFEAHNVFTCTGQKELNGISFVCNRALGHGDFSLEKALAHSCNVYFYELALATSPEMLTTTAEKMGFTKSIALSRGISSPAGVLPSPAILSQNSAAVANYAIGQGDIMISPLNLAAAYAAIANDGVYHTPQLISGTIESGKFLPSATHAGEKILSADTCRTIKKALSLAVTEGTGKSAMPEGCSAAGKTATAQTGWLKDGRSVLVSWFAGYFPAEDPKYVVVLMKEDGNSGSSDCAPVFKAIADRIWQQNTPMQ